MLLAGGQGSRTLAFDVQPAPTADIARLIASGDDVRVRIKMTQSSQSLVRLGVWARPRGQREVLADEVVVLLQLAAHAPPRILWSGPGDQANKGADGCVTDRFVEFQMLFSQLNMLTTARTRPGCPPAGPGVQEQLPLRPVPLAPGRVLSK
jgi:hypothetical protein